MHRGLEYVLEDEMLRKLALFTLDNLRMGEDMIQLLSSTTQQRDDMEERVTVFTEQPSIKTRSNTSSNQINLIRPKNHIFTVRGSVGSPAPEILRAQLDIVLCNPV